MLGRKGGLRAADRRSAGGRPSPQIALKLPAGALTALVGVILLQAALTPTTQAVAVGKIAAIAVRFRC